jgi:hypothetical protein
MKALSIDQLRPTQMTHGERQIRQKAAAYAALSGHDLDMAIAEKPIAVVRGPGGEPFVIDHHHVATALSRVKVKRVPVVLVRDWSSLSWAEFWLALENSSWTYPYDASGRRVPFAMMPRHMWDAVDDEFRSIAAFVRDAGGYEKTAVPLAEFRWADFFRAHLPAPASDAQFDSVLRQAVALAHTDAALGLPGYTGES